MHLHKCLKVVYGGKNADENVHFGCFCSCLRASPDVEQPRQLPLQKHSLWSRLPVRSCHENTFHVKAARFSVNENKSYVNKLAVEGLSIVRKM